MTDTVDLLLSTHRTMANEFLGQVVSIVVSRCHVVGKVVDIVDRLHRGGSLGVGVDMHDGNHGEW